MRSKQAGMTKWTKIKKLASGHRVFRADDGRYALVDDSGDTPDQADDGVLWLDVNRALQLHTDWLCIPVRNHADQPYVVMTEPRDLTIMVTLHTRWPVGVTPEARQLRDLVNAVERYAARPATCDHSNYVTRRHPDTGEEQPFCPACGDFVEL